MNLDREFEILQEWINYRVDWYATYLTVGKTFFIDQNAIPRNYTPYELFRLWQEQGVYYTDLFVDPIIEHKCMTFEQFKQAKNE